MSLIGDRLNSFVIGDALRVVNRGTLRKTTKDTIEIFNKNGRVKK